MHWITWMPLATCNECQRLVQYSHAAGSRYGGGCWQRGVFLLRSRDGQAGAMVAGKRTAMASATSCRPTAPISNL